jgi:hypothetical protein
VSEQIKWLKAVPVKKKKKINMGLLVGEETRKVGKLPIKHLI